MNRKLWEDARNSDLHFRAGSWGPFAEGEEESGGYNHRAGDGISKISRLYPTSRAVSKFYCFNSLAIQESEENNIIFQRRKKKRKENMQQTLLCVFLT